MPANGWNTHCVELLNGAIKGGVSVLLVHVVVACPRLVPHPHAKVLHCCGLLLKDLGIQGEVSQQASSTPATILSSNWQA